MSSSKKGSLDHARELDAKLNQSVDGTLDENPPNNEITVTAPPPPELNTPGQQALDTDNDATTPPAAIAGTRKETIVPTFDTVIVNGQEVTVLHREFLQLNDSLRKNILAVDVEQEKTYASDLDKARVSRQATQEINGSRTERINEFFEGFQWDVPTNYTDEKLSQEYDLESELAVTRRFLPEVERKSATTVAKFAGVLNDMLKNKVTHSYREETFREVHIGSQEFMPIRQNEMGDLLVDCHDVLHADPFNYLRGELNKSNERLALLDASLDNGEQQRKDALTAEDVRVAENVSFQMVLEEEKCLKEMRDRLEKIAWAQGDVEEYYKKAEAMNESASTNVKATKDQIELEKARLEADIAKLQEAIDKRAAEYEEKQEEYLSKIKAGKQQIVVLTKSQDDLWQEIENKLREMQRAGEERNREIKALFENVQQQQEHAKAYADFDAVSSDHMCALVAFKEHNNFAREMHDGISKFIGEVLERVANRPVADELEDIRVGEQMRYLDYFKRFLKDAETLRHSRHRRIENISRMERTVQLSKAQAIATLDPNRSKYEAELTELGQEREGLQVKVADMVTRLDREASEWKEVQESLEAAGISFVPPDIDKEELSCALQDKAIKVTKEYLQKEQLMLDKASSDLRKLKVSHDMSKEILEKRRAELEEHQSPTAIRYNAARSPSPTKDVAAPAASAPAPSAAPTTPPSQPV
eukprot:PhM_4_TR13841/c0_g1_i1/m.79003